MVSQFGQFTRRSVADPPTPHVYGYYKKCVLLVTGSGAFALFCASVTNKFFKKKFFCFKPQPHHFLSWTFNFLIPKYANTLSSGKKIMNSQTQRSGVKNVCM